MKFLPFLMMAFASFCTWLMVRIVNRRERWTKWMAGAMVLVLAYATAYGVMMQPFLQTWRPGGGFGFSAIGRPEYRWGKNGELASRSRLGESFFCPSLPLIVISTETGPCSGLRSNHRSILKLAIKKQLQKLKWEIRGRSTISAV